MTEGKQGWMEGIDGTIDAECLQLCHALNELPGIKTYESCSGHGKERFAIYFVTENLDTLIPVAYFSGTFHDWRVIAYTDCSMDKTKFVLEGPVGASDEADRIAYMMGRWTPRVREVAND